MIENYQLQLDEILKNLGATVPKLLLHSCCGPCSTYVLQYLTQFFDITVYFYNPNIMPMDEYQKRLQAQRQVLDKMEFAHKIDFVEAEYENNIFLAEIKGLENEPEHGKRCKKCMGLRIEKAASYAKEHGYDYFCTTLSVSPHKDAVLLHELCKTSSEKFKIDALPADFKKKNGYLQSTRLSKELGLYRQNYCGCIFSKTDRNI